MWYFGDRFFGKVLIITHSTNNYEKHFNFFFSILELLLLLFFNYLLKKVPSTTFLARVIEISALSTSYIFDSQLGARRTNMPGSTLALFVDSHEVECPSEIWAFHDCSSPFSFLSVRQWTNKCPRQYMGTHILIPCTSETLHISTSAAGSRVYTPLMQLLDVFPSSIFVRRRRSLLGVHTEGKLRSTPWNEWRS